VTTKKRPKRKTDKKNYFLLAEASFFFTRNKTARLIKTWNKLWHNTLTQVNSPENGKTNRLVVVLSDSEISELFHFQIIGDILDMFWLSQHGACLTNKQTNKTKQCRPLQSSCFFSDLQQNRALRTALNKISFFLLSLLATKGKL
jgi:hypothetical protein